MSLNNELKSLREENHDLREKLETAHRELADSVRAEIELKFKIQELFEIVDELRTKNTTGESKEIGS
jgi:uncharacterized coiled-coil DUF342 family protein